MLSHTDPAQPFQDEAHILVASELYSPHFPWHQLIDALEIFLMEIASFNSSIIGLATKTDFGIKLIFTTQLNAVHMVIPATYKNLAANHHWRREDISFKVQPSKFLYPVFFILM